MRKTQIVNELENLWLKSEQYEKLKIELENLWLKSEIFWNNNLMNGEN